MNILKSKTIFIIEDDQDISDALSSLLKDEGYNVVVAENGVMALILLKQYGLPHLILLDMMMPVMSGPQFVEKFALEYADACPIILMTAAENASQRAQNIGAIAWIVKPFSLIQLIELVKLHERK